MIPHDQGVKVGSLFVDEKKDLVVTYDVWQGGKSWTATFLNARIHQDLADIDPFRISYNKDAYEAAIETTISQGSNSRRMGRLLSKMEASCPASRSSQTSGCQWPVHQYVKLLGGRRG